MNAAFERHLARLRARAERLSSADEVLLIDRAHAGDAAARDRVVRAYLLFVAETAWRQRWRGLGFEDAFAVGSLGLLHALAKFDTSRGVRFLSYAAYWIRAYIDNASRAARGEKKRGGVWRPGPGFVPLDEPLADGEGASTRGDLLASPAPTPEARFSEAEETHVRALRVSKALRSLPLKERSVVGARYLEDEPQTLAQVAEARGYTREGIRQIEIRALKRLRQKLRAA
jgi:RNA polymerase primary sigma factor